MAESVVGHEDSPVRAPLLGGASQRVKPALSLPTNRHAEPAQARHRGENSGNQQ
jgi:hypothetical protein